IQRQGAIAISESNLHLALADYGVRIAGENEYGLPVRTVRLIEHTSLEIELAHLRRVPGLCFRILRRCSLRRQLHRLQCALKIAPQLARIGHAGVRRRARSQRHHRVEHFESFVVLPELDQSIAHNAVIPRITWTKVAGATTDVQRVAKTVPREI